MNPSPIFNAAAASAAVTNAKLHGGYDAALASLAMLDRHVIWSAQYGVASARESIAKCFGKDPELIESIDEFLNPKLRRAVERLTDKDYAQKIFSCIEMNMEGQISDSMFRSSYRSKNFRYHAVICLKILCGLIRAYYYGGDTVQLMKCNHDGGVVGLECLIAEEIRSGNTEVKNLLREAIYGDNSEIPLTIRMIHGIVISGDTELLEDLGKLLLTAGLQEGLRQNILEAADEGSAETMIYLLKLCLDNDLFRFSSAIRAFSVWSGLGFESEKAATVKKYAALAYECLVDEAKRRAYLESSNNLEAYFALWAMGCYEAADTDAEVEKLLTDERHYRRVLGWYFVRSTDSEQYKMQTACRFLDERDEELLAWIISCLEFSFDSLRGFGKADGKWKRVAAFADPLLPASKAERRELFGKLEELARFIGKKSKTFKGNPFEYTSVELGSGKLLMCMMSLAAYDVDEELIDRLMGDSDLMDYYSKKWFISGYLIPEKKYSHHAFLRSLLSDRSQYIRLDALERLADCKLDDEDIDALVRGLRSKDSSFRQQILAVLKKQPAGYVQRAVSALLDAKEEYQRQSGIELVMELKEVHPKLLKENSAVLNGLREKNISTQTEILLDKLLPRKKEAEYTKENGYGLYSPKAMEAFAASLKTDAAGKKGILGRFKESGELKALIPDADEVARIGKRVLDVFECHADYEYTARLFDGSQTKKLFGNFDSYLALPEETGVSYMYDPKARLHMLPFFDDFSEAFGDYLTDMNKALRLYRISAQDRTSQSDWYEHCAWYLPYLSFEVPNSLSRSLAYKLNTHSVNQSLRIHELAAKLPLEFDSHELFEAVFKIYQSCANLLGEENVGRAYRQLKPQMRNRVYVTGPYKNSFVEPDTVTINSNLLTAWRSLIKSIDLDDCDFAEWFRYEYRLESAVGCRVYYGFDYTDYFRACDINAVPRDVLTEYIVNARNDNYNMIGILTNPARFPRGREHFERYPWAAEYVDGIIERLVSIEEKRGETPTDTTEVCRKIERLKGAEHFCNLLAALGKDNFSRGYEYFVSDDKKSVLSSLLKHCYPAEGDAPELLAALLKKTDIGEKRLAEAVMYAPQWAGFAEKILGWKGLKCGVWFFHAHINENFSAEKETEVAIFSPISPQQFNDGAFDKNWFFEAYEQLGEKRFDILYKSAKYITSGSNQHRRSQLYADAVLGRLNAEELKAEIIEKRNQERLRCYPLIPIEKGDKTEALRRYEFIQQFLKESKQFGAQRRESEKKACMTALENLAITTGLMDVNRLMWQMESQKLDEIRPLMENRELCGVLTRLEIDENGDAELVMEKNGKRLKTAPKELAKNAELLELKATAKELKEQKRRSRESLETAMVNSTEFERSELENIMGNPVISPMLKKLLWVSGDDIGFPEMCDGKLLLRGLNGISSAGEILRIAHAHDLKSAGLWAEFMHLLYANKIVQPFKQVFREYYPITAEEISERTISRRYAGHQVQSKRTLALLKSRGWTVDYEEGLQKVFYKEDLIVRMFALADWFSPADIEPPTLETVEFFGRGTDEVVALEDVPPVLFSETMRDIDLVVSVAHAGGVDPEASHSTVEMRTAIAQELVELLGLSNVSWVGSHAKIRGNLASWSVHMGSGIVHAEGIGMIAIIPVHSQTRGRIFLPFADDDPKTAEIMSKIILLAEDKKIKDPSILDQLR